MNSRSVMAMVLAYLVPGAGHFYLGHRARAVAFFAIIVFMFVIGLNIDGGIYTLAESKGQLLKLLATIGSMGSGVMYFLASGTRASAGNLTSITFEYGRTFTLTAGLMNLLLVLDAYDLVHARARQ